MRRTACLVILTLLCATWLTASATADIVVLKSGGRIEGEVIDRGDFVEIRIRAGVSTTIARKDIKEIIIKKSPIQMYQERARLIADNDSLGHYHLGLWCKDQNLARQAEKEFKKAIKIDPEHAESRKELGHEKIDGKWLTKEEIMTEKGFVKYKGRWMPKEDADKKKALADLLKGIKTDIKEIEKAKGEPPVHTIEKLSTITNPAALDVLTRALRSKSVHVRIAAVASLGNIGNDKTRKTFLSMTIKDKDNEVRAACAKSLFTLSRRTGKTKELKKLIQTMFKQGYPDHRRAAAEALGNIGDKSFITYIIRALVITIEVRVKDDNDPFGVPKTQEEKDKVGKVGWRPRKPTASGGLDIGPKKNKVKKPWNNVKALEALKKMTGQDFGYDQKQWKEWHLNELEKEVDRENPEPEDENK